MPTPETIIPYALCRCDCGNRVRNSSSTYLNGHATPRKLNTDQVCEIKRLMRAGEQSKSSIAKQYGISATYLMVIGERRNRITGKRLYATSKKKIDRRNEILRMIDEGLSCRVIAEHVGCTYQNVCLVAKRSGTPLRKRLVKPNADGKPQPVRFVVTEVPRPNCRRCGLPVRFAGFGNLGNRRTMCPRCKIGGWAGETKRAPVKMDYEFYRRIGLMANRLRWGGTDNREDLFYPFSCPAIQDDDMVMTINKLVRRSLPEQMRADVCQEIVVAILEGELTIEKLDQETVNKFVKKEYKNRGYDLSLDSLRFSGDRSLGEKLGIY